MKDDFEVHNIGHFEEIKLSRLLANAIEKEISSMPDSVLKAYVDLKKHYEWQIENGVQ